MPTLTIGDKSVTVDDSFLKLSPEQQNAAVSDIAKSLGASGAAAPEAASDPVTTNQVVRATATGVPVVGGLLNQANAATNAALAPVFNPLFDEKDQLKGKTFGERRKESLAIQEGMDKRFEEQSPIIDTVAKVAGGVAGSIPMMMAAPAAFGLTGTLPQMVARGAASNAALGGVDAVTRGQDPLVPAAIGGVLGATLPLAGRAVGKLAQGVREMRNPTPPVAQNVESVAGVDIPLTAGQKASDPVMQAEEEIMRRGGRGGSAESIARKADEEARRTVEQASGNIAASFDPRAAPAAADANPVPAQFRAGTKDDTGPWFLGSDKPLYANATRDSLDKLYGPQVAAQFDQFPSVKGVNKKGQPITVWHKPGEEARALREVENFKLKADAAPGEEARLHYESGLNLGYPEPAARAYVEKRFGSGVLGQASDRTAPQAAAETVQSELAAQAAARTAAEQQTALRVAAEGDTLARGLGGGAAPVSPFDAAESTGAAVTRARDAKVAATREAYKARDAVEGTFEQSVPSSMSEEIRRRAALGDASERLHIDRVNENISARALKVIDNTLFENLAIPEAERVAVAPARAPAVVAAKATEDETAAALREKFGDSVADAYVKQNQPPPLSLVEFIASKGGLSPHGELDAIGLNQSQRAQIPGQKGFFGVVRKNGADIDRMREAAEEAGYLKGADGGTSTPAQFLDALDAELRGQKKYPAGFEGFKNKREVAGGNTREALENERINRGFDDDLAAAGHGGLGPDVKARAVAVMREEGMAADDAVETAFRQLEQEDAAGAMRAASSFPGDAPMAAAAPAAAAASKSVDLRTMDEARKQLVTMLTDAKKASLAPGGTGADYRAMSRILHEFDNVIDDALKAGKFSGDAELAKELQTAARRSHAEYRQTFSSRGSGDEIGRAVEKILGRYNDTAATPGEIAKLSYGPVSAPGSGNTEKVALRLRDILGEDSPEWKQYKQGLFQHVAQAEAGDAPLAPAKAAGRIDKFLNGQTSRFANRIFSPEERRQMANYAKNLRATEPKAGPLNEVDKAVARIAGTDGHLPASPVEVADMLYGRMGKGDKGLSVRMALRLKADLKSESWTAVRQGMWEKLTVRGDGLEPYGTQALSTRLHDFLNENGKPLARILFTKAEREEMAKLASVYKRMTPLKGTTNPSGTAPMLAKIASKASDNVLALIGLGTGGVPGAIAGHVVQRGGEALKDARAAKEATRLFFGPQARRPAGHSRLPQLIGASAIPASQR